MAKIFEILTFPFLLQTSLDSVDLGLSSFYLHSFYNTHTMNTYTVAHLGTHTHTHTFTSTSSHASTLTHTYTLSVLFVSFAASHSVSLFLFIPFLPFFLILILNLELTFSPFLSLSPPFSFFGSASFEDTLFQSWAEANSRNRTKKILGKSETFVGNI